MHKEKSPIEIRLAGLMQGIHEFDFTCKASDFTGWQLAEAGFTRDITVKVVVEKSETEVTITLEVLTIADFTCDICLAPVSKKLSGSLRLYYVSGTSFGEELSENEDYRVLDKNAESIDITTDVCETLLLSLPLKVTCTDNPDCRLYGSNVPGNEEPQVGENSSWHESLEKLKNKYR
ncbi:MAG: DUF177 domain-containing protein [Chlorobium sp.]|nr:MAG: DUF177 domain-containing protein [Chlorobium sp.]